MTQWMCPLQGWGCPSMRGPECGLHGFHGVSPTAPLASGGPWPHCLHTPGSSQPPLTGTVHATWGLRRVAERPSECTPHSLWPPSSCANARVGCWH